MSVRAITRLSAGLALALSLSPAVQAADTYSADQVRADLSHLYTTLQASHVNLFVQRPKQAYDQRYQVTRRSIDGAMDHLDVVRLFMPFVAYGQIGHAKIDFPVADYIDYYKAGGTLLPIDIRFNDGRPVLAYSYSDHPALQPGLEVLRINERPMDDWLERTGRFVSAERPYMAHAQLESMFPRLMWLSEGKMAAFAITLQMPDGAEATVVVDGESVATVEEAKGIRETDAHRREAQMLDGQIAYLRPGPFYAASQDESLESVTAFFDQAFEQFIAAGAQDLIIDLRNNPGGDNSFSDPMIAWFADEPFRFASRYEIKASPETRRVLEGLAERYPGGISADMKEAVQARTNGERFDFEIPLALPRDDARYTGRVWTLISRHSYSNATAVAAIIKDYGFGTLVGEETADLPTSYASSAKFTLPNTGLEVTYPKGYFVRPNGKTGWQGVLPDQRIERPTVPGEADVVLQQLKTLVLQQRR